MAVLFMSPLAVGSPYYTSVMIFLGIHAILATGLGLLMGQAGQISLGQAAFYAVGAYVSGVSTARYGISPWISLVLAVGVSLLLAFLIGVPALRLQGYYFAMATLGFGIIVQIVVEEIRWLTGGVSGLSGIPTLSMMAWALDTDLKYFYLVWGMFAGLFVAAINIVHSRVGNSLRALHWDEAAADILGVRTYRCKLQILLVSVVYASLAGSLYAHYVTFLGPEVFGFMLSVKLAVMVVVGGMQSLWGPVFGAILFTWLPEYLRAYKDYDIIIFGTILILTMMFMPKGIAYGFGAVGRRAVSIGFRPSARVDSQAAKGITPEVGRLVESRGREGVSGPLLQVRGLGKSFGGVRAIHNLTFAVEPKQIKGIIGPNGAGKTTLFNLVNGQFETFDGEISFEGVRLNGCPPHRIARLGIGRTFQNVRLFPDLSVLENVIVACAAWSSSGFPQEICRMRSARAEEREVLDRAQHCLAFVGLEAEASGMVSGLAFGTQRRLEIARALAANPRLLLLDEPAAGLDPSEMRNLVDLIYRLRREGVTVLLIEHKMDLVMQICDQIVVLNHGQKIAEGTVKEIQNNDAVISAYLGDGTPAA